MAEWTDKEEFAALLTAAAGAINDALADGKRAGHAPGSYREESLEHQIYHLEAHITAFQCGDRNEDHLGHIVCRAAIAYALRQRRAASCHPEPVEGPARSGGKDAR